MLAHLSLCSLFRGLLKRVLPVLYLGCRELCRSCCWNEEVFASEMHHKVLLHALGSALWLGGTHGHLWKMPHLRCVEGSHWLCWSGVDPAVKGGITNDQRRTCW